MPDLALYRDRTLATGLAAAPGAGREEVTEVAQLPEHRVEVHSFTSHALALAFAEGFELAGGNAVACHREPESREGLLVVVAFLSEDRDPDAATLEEAVRVVGHDPSGEEGRIIARHLEETVARREREHEARVAVTAPVVELLRAAGVESHYDGNIGHRVRASWGSKEAFLHAGPAEGGGGLWRATISWHDESGFLHEPELDPRLAEILGSYGIERVDDGREGAFPPCAPAELPRLAALARECWDRLRPVLLEVWRERSAAAEAERRRRTREASNRRSRERRSGRG